MAHNILAFRRPVALLLLVCIFHARHATYLGTCAASFSFCCDPLRVLRRRRISYMSGLALLGRVLVVYLHRGAVRYLFFLLVYLLPRCACFVGFLRCAAHNILACRRPVALLLSMCGLFWGAHKSLAPRARTLLGGLGQATLSFFAVATLLFFFFGECPKFCDLAKQRRIIVGGVSEVGKDDFSLYFFWPCVRCGSATGSHWGLGQQQITYSNQVHAHIQSILNHDGFVHNLEYELDDSSEDPDFWKPS